jgi:hypothetical protein
MERMTEIVRALEALSPGYALRYALRDVIDTYGIHVVATEYVCVITSNPEMNMREIVETVRRNLEDSRS